MEFLEDKMEIIKLLMLDQLNSYGSKYFFTALISLLLFNCGEESINLQRSKGELRAELHSDLKDDYQHYLNKMGVLELSDIHLLDYLSKEGLKFLPDKYSCIQPINATFRNWKN